MSAPVGVTFPLWAWAFFVGLVLLAVLVAVFVVLLLGGWR